MQVIFNYYWAGFAKIFIGISTFIFISLSYATSIILKDTGQALKNPGMGWSIYYYANSLKYYAIDINKYSDKQLFSFPGLAVATFRLSWSQLEPSEGVYQWDLIDVPAKRFIDNGVQIAIRVSNSENVADQPYATPKWVFDAGAKANRFRPGYPGTLDLENGANREPVFDDPIFLSKLENFVSALAHRYDGKLGVAFVDVGSFGVYGEGHTWSSTKLPYPEKTILRHIDIYNKYFKKTRLIANHNFADHNQNSKRNMFPIEYSAALGLGLRDDSILLDRGKRAFYDESMAQLFYKNAPVILETGEYSSRIRKGYWDAEKVIQAVKAYRASYIGAYWRPLDYMNENHDLIDRVNKILGYRFNFVKVAYDDVVTYGGEIRIKYSLRNVGVAKCLKNGWVEFSLHTDKGKKVASSVDRLNNICEVYNESISHGLQLNHAVKFDFTSAPVLPGKYNLYVAVVDEQGVPWLALPHDFKMDKEYRYKVGDITLSKKIKVKK